jgi:hypothetical protein
MDQLSVIGFDVVRPMHKYSVMVGLQSLRDLGPPYFALRGSLISSSPYPLISLSPHLLTLPYQEQTNSAVLVPGTWYCRVLRPLVHSSIAEPTSTIT